MVSTQGSILGYHISEELYNGERTLVYRGYGDDQKPVVIKLLRNLYPSFSELAQFRNQYTIAKNLNFPGIIQTYSLEPYENGYVLVMEDGGISLKEWSQGIPLSLTEFLPVALALCDIVNILNRHRIIHKDIKPANILINADKQVKLIDFSLASDLPREAQTVISPNVLQGTLGYLSPEQTGRMNRGIDYRSDFYSLGVTFYELLTGQLPFQSDDAMELIHCHIAKLPPTVHDINPQVAPVLSKIISTLMAKNAEDRYQSALGLKYDLEIAWKQLQETGKIEDFQIKQRDVCDRFIVPEKLYGREQEIQTLLEAFNRVTHGQTELMLVAGFSGIGKTAIVNEVHKPIVTKRGYFIKGKFDQFNRNLPFSAFVQALSDLMGQLVSESDRALETWKTQILTALSDNAQVIIEVIPELELIIGKQPKTINLSGTAAQNRFNSLFSKFIQVFTSIEHPLVIFLDDLQWADLASLNLIQLLMSSDHKYLLLIGAYRDHEVFAAHPLMLTLKEIEKNVTINTITLAPLTEGSLNQLVADTLSCLPEVAQSLTQLVYQRTKGNPFFSRQFLKMLYEDRLIQFDFQVGHWQCDIIKVKELIFSDDVVEFMALQLQKLPNCTQDVLKLAACIGNQFDLETLAIVYEQSHTVTATHLWKAREDSLIIPTSQVHKFFQAEDKLLPENAWSPATNHPSYKFLHDRIQQAAYSLIPPDQKQSTHLKIGQLLLANATVKRDENIFAIVNQLNYGVELITQRQEREQLAQLNLIAAQKARSSTAYSAASRYANEGISLLDADCWHCQYELALALHEIAAEVTYLNGNFDQTELLIQTVLAEARTLIDQVNIYEIRIQADAAQSQLLSAVNTALVFLKLFDIEFPEHPTQSNFQDELQKINIILKNQRVEDLIHLPEITTPEPIAIMRIISNIIPLSFSVMPALFPLFILKQVYLSLQYGNTPTSAFAYANYGLMLCGIVGDIEAGYQFGELAMSLASNQTSVTAKVIFVFATMIKPWKEHVEKTLKLLLTAYKLSLETGNLEFAAYALYDYCNNAYFLGHNLENLEQEIATYNQAIERIQQERSLNCNQITQQAILNLLGQSETPCRLIGRVYNAEQMLAIHLQESYSIELLEIHRYQLQLCYLFGEYHQALWNATQAEQYLMAGISKLSTSEFYLYDSLTRLALYPQLEASEQLQILERIAINQSKMQHWSNHAPMNFLHKFYLVEAEKQRVLGQRSEAMDLYDLAITLAKETAYIQQEALANELAAKFYLAKGKEKIAQTYMIEAYYCYARWGAKAKTDDLEKHYPQLLDIIWQRRGGSSIDKSSSLHQSIQTSRSSNTISESLDFATLFKASLALSSEIQLEQLIYTLMQVLMENAGAKKAALLLIKDGDLILEAIATINQDVAIVSLPLSRSLAIPVTLINYVSHTLKTILIDDFTSQNNFITDPYLMQQQPHSVLCIPILQQRKLIGLLYLENQLAIGVFTEERLKIIQILCAQAAISLENARLYQQAQNYAQQLETSLHSLRHTQLQMVQNEKMATLGNLVAGVAHEINNPLGFLKGSLNNAQEYIQDIFAHMQLLPTLDQAVINHAEEIDLEFITDDLPKLIDSMKVATERIQDLSTSLRTFSRADTAKKVATSLQEGIESTLLILKYRLKASEKRPAIEVITEYALLPPVKCFLGQLNQVFMNILANAIDVLDTSLLGQTFAQIQAKPQIFIRTEVSSQSTVAIRIKDNGPGMPEEIKAQIFDHLFTTKEVGQGTGLGLAIARQIVEEVHNGTLYCNSVLGEGTEFVIEIPLT